MQFLVQDETISITAEAQAAMSSSVTRICMHVSDMYVRL